MHYKNCKNTDSSAAKRDWRSALGQIIDSDENNEVSEEVIEDER